jgi:predicted enzyme related to lactoylglutathione lyase
MATGEISHVEIPADDVERAKRFYAAVVGWTFQDQPDFPDYHMFQTGPNSGGAIGTRGVSVGSVVRPYVTVDRLEDAVAAAEANGGSVKTPPQEIPGGRWAAVTDSEGNEIGLWETPQGS